MNNKTVGEVLEATLEELAMHFDIEDEGTADDIRQALAFLKEHKGGGIVGMTWALAVYMLISPGTKEVLTVFQRTAAPIVGEQFYEEVA